MTPGNPRWAERGWWGWPIFFLRFKILNFDFYLVKRIFLGIFRLIFFLDFFGGHH